MEQEWVGRGQMSSELQFSLEKVTVHPFGVKEIEGEAMAQKRSTAPHSDFHR